MSCKEYLHERAEESRHNETLASLMFVAGVMLFIGGMVETVSLAKEPQWFLIIPYFTQPFEGAVLGLSLIISGLALVTFGIFAGVYYANDRSWYMRELRSLPTTPEENFAKTRKAVVPPKKAKEKPSSSQVC